MQKSFNGDYAFLSNFFPAPFILNGFTYPTAEHFFQASKTLDPAEQLGIISGCKTALEAKQAGKKVHLRKDWEKVKVQIMRTGVYAKFAQNPQLQKRLVDTWPEKLIENNNWGDTFWGVCDGVGENHLGKILMELRRDLIIGLPIDGSQKTFAAILAREKSVSGTAMNIMTSDLRIFLDALNTLPTPTCQLYNVYRYSLEVEGNDITVLDGISFNTTTLVDIHNALIEFSVTSVALVDANAEVVYEYAQNGFELCGIRTVRFLERDDAPAFILNVSNDRY